METLLVQIRDFNQPAPEVWEAVVPKNTVPKKLIANNSGIMVFCETPSIKTDEQETLRFVTIGPGKTIPLHSDYFDVVDFTLDNGDGSFKHIVLPIYRLLQ